MTFFEQDQAPLIDLARIDAGAARQRITGRHRALMTTSQGPWFRFMTIEFIDFLRPRVLHCVLSLCTRGLLEAHVN
jgi:hypothetical protein